MRITIRLRFVLPFFNALVSELISIGIYFCVILLKQIGHSDVGLVCLLCLEDPNECAGLALVELVVVAPALGLIGVDESSVRRVHALEDLQAVLLHVLHILLGQLKVVLRAVVQVARLSNQHRRHLVSDELLPAIQSGQRRESR